MPGTHFVAAFTTGADLDHLIGLRTVDKPIKHRTDVFLHAEHPLYTAPHMFVQHLIGVVATVIHHHIRCLQCAQVAARQSAFIAMGDDIKVHRNPGFQPVQTTHHPLRIIGVVRGTAVAGFDQRPRQIDFRPVNGMNPVVLPR